MSAGPVGPGDPTMPAGPGGPPQGGPGYAPGPDQRFERGPAPGYGYPQQGGYDGGGGHDRAAEAAEFARRHIRTPETKEFYKTSEFAIWTITFLCIVIAGLISENLFSHTVWLYVTILSSAYMISRGLAKTAARRGDAERHWGHDHQH
jgi:hypothetical protein